MGEEGVVYKVGPRSEETTHNLEEGTLIVCTGVIKIEDRFDPKFRVYYEYWMETIEGVIQVLYEQEFEETEQPQT